MKTIILLAALSISFSSFACIERPTRLTEHISLSSAGVNSTDMFVKVNENSAGTEMRIPIGDETITLTITEVKGDRFGNQPFTIIETTFSAKQEGEEPVIFKKKSSYIGNGISNKCI